MKPNPCSDSKLMSKKAKASEEAEEVEVAVEVKEVVIEAVVVLVKAEEGEDREALSKP